MRYLAGNLSRRHFGRTMFAALCAGGAATTGLLAEEQPVRLTVVNRDGAKTTFTDAQLDLLAPKMLDTTTYWTDGVQHFDGVLMRDALAAGGIDLTLANAELEAMAHNDYTVRLPLADSVTWDVLIARRMNGTLLTLRDKGPLWIVYPRDDHDILKVADYNHRWVWQLKQLKLV